MMCIQGRCQLLWLLALFACGGGASSATGEPPDAPLEMLNDAELTAVFFLDSDIGWAVGDRGVVLRTEDGGRNWQLQRTPTNCRLESVHFINADDGWAAGGWIHPYTHRTSGVVLQTRDGGKRWTAIRGTTLPQLKQIGFLNRQRGWAVGTPSFMYPTGIFRTEDGGRSWTTLPAGVSGHWLAADFTQRDRGVVVGHDGQLAIIHGSQVQASRTPNLGLRSIRSVRFESPHHGWLVGDGGLVLNTMDGGARWQTWAESLPEGAADLFDFHALAVVGPHVWIAGTPGSCILYSPDRGETWQLLRTDQTLPIRDLTFIDPQRGWAVGALGTILVTRDGGHTWRPQKTGATRLALLGLFAEPDQIPFELFARESGDDGYISFAEILGRRDVELPERQGPGTEDQCAAAMSAVGSSGADRAWNFPLRQAGLMLATDRVVETWNRANDGRGLEQLEELVVRKIRQWRPDVIITEPAGPDGGTPLAHITNQVVLHAVRQAADATRYADHITVAGLEPWKVSKVFSRSGAERQATTTFTTTHIATGLGRSIADQASQGYALINPGFQPVPVTVGYRLLMNELPQSVGQKDIFGGIHLQAGGPARREQGRPATQNIEALTRAAQKRRNMEQLIEQTTGSSANPSGWLGQVQDLTEGLRSETAGQVLYQLGQRYRQAGQLELASQTFQQLVNQFPRHPLAEVADVWLIHFHASGEAAWQLKRDTGFQNQQAVAIPLHPSPAEKVQSADYQSQPARNRQGRSEVAQAQFQVQQSSSTASIPSPGTHQATAALTRAKHVQRNRPDLFAEPRVQFPVSVAYRKQGMPREAERFYHRLASLPDGSDWAACAQAELWLAHGRGRPPKPICLCRAAPERPRLDGQLDDALWQQAEKLDLTSAQHDDANWPATAMVARDDQFLYLAVSCRKAPGVDYPSTQETRPRDADLSGNDRVDLLLDLDRDYVSYYRLSVDHRGWTSDDCWDNRHWNPTWYVASHSTETNWSIEAAIPFDQLSAQPPNSQDVWAVGIQRVVPGVGIQAHAHPAAVDPRPEGFSLLVFQ